MEFQELSIEVVSL
jgi:hypothetical protein